MKTLRRLNSNGGVDTLVELSDNIQAIDAKEDAVYLSNPNEGMIHYWNPESGQLEIFVNNVRGIQGIHCQPEVLICESSERHFFSIRYFDRLLTSFVGERARKDLPSTQTQDDCPHPRINGLHFQSAWRTIYFAYPERHLIYQLRDSIICPVIGNRKSGFSIGSGESCSLSHPSDVVVFDNKLLISDTSNHVIREFFIDGFRPSRLLGLPLTSGCVDGIGTKSRLCNPTDMTLQENRLAFIDDYNSIRSVSLNMLNVK